MAADWPTNGDITTELGGAGIAAVLGSYSVTNLRASLIQEVEAITGWVPFKKDTGDVTRRFDLSMNPQTGDQYQWIEPGLFDFGAGLLTLTTLRVGETDTVTGTVLTAGQDFHLWPYDAAVSERPYTGVKFTGFQYGAFKSLAVVGRWGFKDGVPDDLFQAFIEEGCNRILRRMASGQLAGTNVQAPPESLVELFAQREGNRSGDSWERTLRRYRYPAV